MSKSKSKTQVQSLKAKGFKGRKVRRQSPESHKSKVKVAEGQKVQSQSPESTQKVQVPKVQVLVVFLMLVTARSGMIVCSSAAGRPASFRSTWYENFL